MQEIYLHSLPIKEYQIVDYFLPKLKDEVMKVISQTGVKVDGRFALYKNKLVLVKGLDSRLLSSSATAMVMSVLVSNVPRKWPPPFAEP